MIIHGIIPARYASSRLPGKPLVDIAGKTMIQRVYEQASKASCLEKVIVATDDQKIFDAVKKFGGAVEMTSETHQNGTERIAEVAQKSEADAFINIQGDEPFLAPQHIKQVANLLKKKAAIATLIQKIKGSSSIDDPGTVKVVIDKNYKALYFSRSAIPFLRNKNEETPCYKHLGIYGFQKNTLLEIVKLPPSALEKAESLEQLRWLENGYDISTAETEINSLSIDTSSDLKKAEIYLRERF